MNLKKYKQHMSKDLSNPKKSEIAGRIAAMEDLALHTFLKAYCRDKEFIYKPSYNITTKSVISDFNLINDPCCDLKKYMSIKQKLEPLKLYDMHLEKLVSVSNHQLMTNIDNIVNTPDPIIQYDSHCPIITYCLLILFMFFVFYKLCKGFGKCPTFLNKTKPDSALDEVQEMKEIPIPRIRIST